MTVYAYGYTPNFFQKEVAFFVKLCARRRETTGFDAREGTERNGTERNEIVEFVSL